jgi:hypothetical protein
MFEVGRSYRITTAVGDDFEYSTYQVVKVELPLISLSQPGRTVIFNTSSSFFVSAELDDPEARQAAQAKWLDSLSDHDKSL